MKWQEYFYALYKRGCAFIHQLSRNKGIEQECYTVTEAIQNNTVLEPWVLHLPSNIVNGSWVIDKEI